MYCSRIALNSSWPAVSRTRTEETKIFSYCEGPVAAGTTVCVLWPFLLCWACSKTVRSDEIKLDGQGRFCPRLHSPLCVQIGSRWRGKWLCGLHSTKYWSLNLGSCYWSLNLGSCFSGKIWLKVFHNHPNFPLSQQRKPKTGRLGKSQFKCQGCMVKQSWETIQSNSYNHFSLLNTWILFLDNFVLSEWALGNSS